MPAALLLAWATDLAKKVDTSGVADVSNPNLKPWVKERMRQDIDELLAGKKSAFTPQSRTSRAPTTTR